VSLAIRPAGPDDVPEILRLIRALALYEREPDAVKASEADLRATLFAGTGTVHAHLVESEGRAVGVALWFLNFSTWTGKPGLYLEDFFIEEPYRGQGGGRAMFATLAAEAVARGCARLEWAVLDWNETAGGFYRRIGGHPATGWQLWRLDGEALTALALG
jgi:GNAT superfamily N-acetyltransferase